MKHFEIYKKDPATGALYPEGRRRKKGLARILEIVVRDFWQLLGSGLIATAAALPYGLCIMLFLPSNALGLLILSCVVTGALASVFGMNLLDTILRCLRDEAGFWSFQYKKSLKNNTLPAALFGAVFGPLFAVDLAGLSLAVRRGQSVFQVEFLVISIIFLLGFALNLAIQIPLMQLPVSALLKNAFLLFRGNLGCSLMAVAALIGYAALFVLLPATLSFLLIVSNLWPNRPAPHHCGAGLSFVYETTRFWDPGPKKNAGSYIPLCSLANYSADVI